MRHSRLSLGEMEYCSGVGTGWPGFKSWLPYFLDKPLKPSFVFEENNSSEHADYFEKETL